jgi:sec-independent protein translocase protein TatA
MPFGIGIPELLIVLLAALLIFGPKRLPEMGRSLGRGMREFKESISGKDDRDDDRELSAPAPRAGESTTVTVTAPPAPSRETDPV